MQLAVTAAKDGTLLSITVVPRGGKTSIAGVMADGTLRIKLGAPPVDNKANEALVRWMANQLDLSTTQISIKSGHTSRRKT